MFFLYKPRVWFTNYGFVFQTLGLFYGWYSNQELRLETKGYFTNPGFDLQTKGLLGIQMKVCFTTKYTLYNQGFALQAKYLVYKHMVWYVNQEFVLQCKGLVYQL